MFLGLLIFFFYSCPQLYYVVLHLGSVSQSVGSSAADLQGQGLLALTPAEASGLAQTLFLVSVILITVSALAQVLAQGMVFASRLMFGPSLHSI